MKAEHNKEASLEELRSILISKGLLDEEEEVIVEMLGDLAHFAYFTGCITKSDVRRLLGINSAEAKSVIKSWKLWDEGNRSCGLTRNPFTEEWGLSIEKSLRDRKSG
jgi:hypothetical protein